MRPRRRPSRGDLLGFPGSVAHALNQLVNQYDVPYRMQDGRHILLFTGRRGEPPLKVSAARPETSSLKYIERWASEHVQGWES